MTRPGIVLLLVLAAACGGSDEPRLPAAQTGSYQGDGKKLYRVPDFHLLESRGVALKRDDLRGKVWVASMIFTTCQTHCITMCAEMVRLQEEFKDEADFRIVATTVDPARDTADVMRRFGKKYDARDTWLFLTGDRPSILGYAKGMKISGDPEEPLAHSVYFVLVDREGWVRGVFHQPDRDRMAKLREMIRTLLAEKTA